MNLSTLGSIVKQATKIWSPGLSAIVAVYLIVVIIGIIAWHVSAEGRAHQRLDRFGTTLSAELADLVIEPLLSQDRIRLGVLANSMTAFDEVAGITIYTVDDQLMAIAGRATSQTDSPTFTHPVTVQDTVGGYVRVSLEPAAFSSSIVDKLAASFSWWLAAFAAVAGVGLLVVRSERSEAGLSGATGLSGANASERPDEPPVFILVVNAFEQTSSTSGQRAKGLSEASSWAQRIASLYGARCIVAGTRIVMVFDTGRSADRPFEVLCASLLLGQALDHMSEARYADVGPDVGAQTSRGPLVTFRFGLHAGPGGGDLAQLAANEHAQDAVLLSALAPNGQLAVSDDIWRLLARPERVVATEQQNAAAVALTTTTALFHIVEDVAPSYRALIAQQARLLLQSEPLVAADSP